MKTFIKRTVIFHFILLAFVFSYGYFCDWYFSSPQFLDHVTNKRAWCLKKYNEKFDLAVLGSSRAFGSFDMHLLSQQTGKKVINLGANGSGYVDNYLILHKFLKNQNKIDRLLLQVDIYSLNSKKSFSNAFHTYEFLPYWNDSIIRGGVSEYLNHREKVLWNYFPQVRYFKYNKYFSPKEVLRRYTVDKKASSFDKNMGGQAGATLQMDNIELATKSEYRSLDSIDIIYLQKIIALCRVNNVKIVAYKAPELFSRQQQIKNYRTLQDQVDKILKNLDVQYLRSDTQIEMSSEFFTNPTHLNNKGRTEFTKTFLTQLRNYKDTQDLN